MTDRQKGWAYDIVGVALVFGTAFLMWALANIFKLV